MRFLCLLFVAITVVGPRSARADATDTIVLASPSLALAGDATALITAPARLGLLRGWNAVYTHAELAENASLLGRGDALGQARAIEGLYRAAELGTTVVL